MTMTETAAPAPIPGERTLLLVDDDKAFLTRLERAMEKRGFEVRIAETVAGGLVVDGRRRPSRSSTSASKTATDSTSSRLSHKRRPDAPAVVLTGYGNIATAVTAVKLGAVDISANRPTPTM